MGKDRVTPQNKNRNKQTQKTKELINNYKSKQSKDRKREMSPNLSCHHTIGPLPICSKEVTHSLNKKLSFRTEHATHREKY